MFWKKKTNKKREVLAYSFSQIKSSSPNWRVIWRFSQAFIILVKKDFLQSNQKKSKSERDEPRERNIWDMGTVEIVTHGKEIGQGEYLWCDSIDQKKSLSEKILMGVFRLKMFKKIEHANDFAVKDTMFLIKREIFECSLFVATFDTKVPEYLCSGGFFFL